MLQTFLVLNMYFLVPYFSCIKFNSKIVSAITEQNTSLCIQSSEHINCSVRAIAHIILRSLYSIQYINFEQQNMSIYMYLYMHVLYCNHDSNFMNISRPYSVHICICIVHWWYSRAQLGGTTRQEFQAPGTWDNFFNTARHTFSQSNSISVLFLTMYGHVKS